MIIVESERLILRRWRAEDLKPFAELNADPRVMEFFPSVMNDSETEQMIARIEANIDRNGFGFWAAERKDNGELIGFVGLSVPREPLSFSPCVEVGWRLAYSEWGKGFAPEGARAALEFGFGKLGLNEIVSYTAAGNLRSRRVMEKIGMRYENGGDFDHPWLEVGHRLRRHVLYRVGAPA